MPVINLISRLDSISLPLGYHCISEVFTGNRNGTLGMKWADLKTSARQKQTLEVLCKKMFLKSLLKTQGVSSEICTIFKNTYFEEFTLQSGTDPILVIDIFGDKVV